ncbi:hypothetical protein CERSUDRAFT_97322 [Gelatoporia subvermispora B]|uniref:RING-type domain-containing protein n=1 Tax=Ceriporiopsis subvermispora (strain B) TaxID=914234 RepID=M2QRC4_CERS8|nr:hypothetical protein CERSUDRAFT_97322 [Gelatoporia subvermispora B]
MSDILYVDMAYCSLCDRYFPSSEARANHVHLSTNHPRCTTCNRRFANKASLRNHWVSSSRHNYCAVCEKDFRTTAGLRAHIEYAAVHRDDTDDDSDNDADNIDDSYEGWEDELGRTVFPDDDPPADDDFSAADPYASEDEYWDEDEGTDLEEEAETYMGFAVVPPEAPRPILSNPEARPDAPEKAADEKKQADRVEMLREKAAVSGILFNCPLCLEPPIESSATRCGHLFCTSCITQSLESKKLCPVCRTSAVPKQLRKIYLSAA